MKCFEVVRNVLDAAYDEIGGSEAERDEKIKAAILVLRESYRNLLTSGGPNFQDPVTRFAYVFTYVAAHAHWVYETISWFSGAHQLFNAERLRVTALGGGPGSDLVGILKYMEEKGEFPNLFFEIMDGCIDWKKSWADVTFSLEWPRPILTDYVIHDLANPATWTSPCHYSKSDLFILSFFVSEIRHLNQLAESYLDGVFTSAKSGAAFIVNDNADSRFSDWLDALAQKNGVQKRQEMQGTRKIYDSNESKAELQRFIDKFGSSAKLQGNVFSRVYIKP